jgi:putative copper export protein
VDIFWRWLHLLAAGFWLGGLVMLAMVTMSAIRVMERPAFRQLIRRVGRAFLVGSIIAWVVLAISGVAMAVTRIHSINELTGTGYGRTLLAKAVLFLLAIIGTVAHTLAGGRASPVAIRLSRSLSPVIFLLTLAIFYLAARLTDG